MLRKLRLDLAARVIAIVATIGMSLTLLSPTQGSQASCIMPTSGTVAGLVLVNDINACNGSLLSLYSGAAPPSTPTTGMLWYNTSTNFVQQYDSAAWNNIWFVDATNHLTTAPIGGGVISATISSGTTTDIGSVPQSFITVNGTTTINSFGTSATVGTLHVIKFANSLTLTYNATSMILPSGGQSIITQTGDIAFAMYLGGGNWQVLTFVPATGAAVANPALPLGAVIYGDFMSAPAKTVYGAGQPVARSAFPGYLAAVTRAQSMTRTSGNATLTGVTDTSGMGAGMPVEGPGIAASCTIASLVANTSITLNNSACVTASGSASITVFGTGYGYGGDTTTVGVKDCRNVVLAGRGDMNGSDRGLFTSSFFGNSGLALNAFGGAQSLALALSQLPTGITSRNAAQTINVTNSYTFPNNGGILIDSLNQGASNPVLFWRISPNNGTTTLTYTGSNDINVTSNNTSGAAHRTVQPTVVANCVVQVLP